MDDIDFDIKEFEKKYNINGLEINKRYFSKSKSNNIIYLYSVITFGKHNGRNLKWIIDNDLEYFHFLATRTIKKVASDAWLYLKEKYPLKKEKKEKEKLIRIVKQINYLEILNQKL